MALLVFGVGVALLTLARAVGNDPSWDWLSFWPLGELGEILVAAGLLGTWVDLLISRDRDRAMTENNRAVQLALMPDTVDTVLRAFAAKPNDMKRVATPEFLDQLATSALTLRLGDEQFAREIYEEVRDQAIRAPERWHNDRAPRGGGL
ncbi:hypothetical protein [Nocardioides humi]|uniref:hypothetical protein n=1 Tax=Nocardioides humi TaxID=449461 RepID=UPI00112B632E|nr:hypothetical protein [Nocardioides humi]